jgi:iron complex transport system ATP-binding protein
MLEAIHISKKIGNKRLLDDVSIQVRPGEVVAIIGPNGAGKSTLMRILSGELHPTAGERKLCNTPIEKWVPLKRAQMLAVLPQHSNLTFLFDVEQVVSIGRYPHAKQSDLARDEAIIAQAMSAAGIDHLSTQVYPTLSGGEQQRVHLARTLAQIWEMPEGNQRYLLLDEPTASLDPSHQHTVLSVARRFANEQTGVLTVLHDLNLASMYADRIVLLVDGKIMAEGKPADVLTRDILQNAFNTPVSVTHHPELDCPLIVYLPTAAAS